MTTPRKQQQEAKQARRSCVRAVEFLMVAVIVVVSLGVLLPANPFQFGRCRRARTCSELQSLTMAIRLYEAQ